MRYGSVCSGIEAATQAWHPLGWEASFFSEIEAFPRAVLSHHYPGTPLHGDFTTIEAGQYETIDVLVGGTPCQSFSVAGLRGGMADERGNLALEYLRLADRLRPRWLVWENVPGVLSSAGGRDFGSFLGGLGQLGYGFAYRVLDAQFFGLAQRRKRVFAIGYLGDWRRAAAVLFEPASLRRHPAPRRKEGEVAANNLTERPDCGGGNSEGLAATLTQGVDSKGKGGYAGRRREDDVNLVVAAPLGSKKDGGWRGDLDNDTYVVAPPLTSNPYGDHESREGLLVAHSLRGRGFDASEDGTGRGTPLVAWPLQNATRGQDQNGLGIGGDVMFTLDGTSQHAVAHTLGSHRAGSCTEDGAGRGVPLASSGSAVRRLTPRECERLQGFPDDYTLIPYRGKLAADGPRYRAIGNSMAVPVMAWIGRRIAAEETRV